MIEVRNQFGADIFEKPTVLRSVLKDYCVETRDVILICVILDDYSNDFKNVNMNNNVESINKLSKKIAYERFINDIKIVKRRIVLLINVINEVDKKKTGGSKPKTGYYDIGNIPLSELPFFDDEESEDYVEDNIDRPFDDDDVEETINKHSNNVPNTPSNNNFAKGHAVSNGKCGPNLEWRLDKDTGYLEITGFGPMYDIEYGTEWKKENEIKNIVIGKGATSIGNSAFLDNPSLETVSIPNSVRSIGDFAFKKCTLLKRIVIPEGVASMGFQAFGGCISLESVELPHSLNISGYKSYFNDCVSLSTLIIPIGIKASYLQVPNWCRIVRK